MTPTLHEAQIRLHRFSQKRLIAHKNRYLINISKF